MDQVQKLVAWVVLLEVASNSRCLIVALIFLPRLLLPWHSPLMSRLSLTHTSHLYHLVLALVSFIAQPLIH